MVHPETLYYIHCIVLSDGFGAVGLPFFFEVGLSFSDGELIADGHAFEVISC